MAYFGGGEDNNVYALNASTGAKLWSFTTGNSVESSPAVANGVVYIGSADQNIYALNATTGAKLWNFTTGAIVESSPTVANGVVYNGSWDYNVYCTEREHRRKAVELLERWPRGSGSRTSRPLLSHVEDLRPCTR